MNRLNRIATLAVFTLLVLSMTNLVHAGASPAFYIRSDKASYVPGDTGSLLITIRNEGDQAFTIKNMTIFFPWMSFINDHWEGNVTVNSINQAFATGQAYNSQQSFTVPSDGRAYRSSSGTVKLGTDIGGNGGSYRTSTFYITMNAPTYTPIEVSTQLFSIIIIGILAVATVLLFLVNDALRRSKPHTAAH